jgi:hypothetical protein
MRSIFAAAVLATATLVHAAEPPRRPNIVIIVADDLGWNHTSVLEGINNKIKVIKRMAYGFRDDAYFFLKIRQVFPGVGR